MAIAGLEMDRRTIGCLVVLGVSLAMLIAGSVMLGVGVHKANQKHYCPPCNNNQIQSTLFTSSYDPEINWDDQLADTSSKTFSTNAKKIYNRVTSHSGCLNVLVNRFTRSSQTTGVNFYATCFYSAATESVDILQKQMTSSGYPSNAYVDPTMTCSGGLVPPPGQNQLSTTTSQSTISASTSSFNTQSLPTLPPCNTSPITPISPFSTTTRSMPPGAYCDASAKTVDTIFLLDIAVPSIGTLDDKLAKIRSFLISYDTSIGLHGSTWDNVQLELVTYDGEQAQLIESCSDDDSWHYAISQLQTQLNPHSNQAHSVIMGLNYLIEKQFTRSGQPNVIIVTDGYDITEQSPNNVANQLKSLNYSIGAVVATPSVVARNVFSSIVSDSFHLFSMDSLDWLSNPAVLSTTAQWSCSAPNPSSVPTQSPLITTPSLLSTTPTTTALPTTTQKPPAFVYPCQQYDDIVLILHANSSSNWDILRQFVASDVLPALLGPLTSQPLTTNAYVNFAVTYYTGQTVNVPSRMNQVQSGTSLSGLISKLPFIPSNETPSLSQAYNIAGQQMGLGRSLASKTVLVITDTVDIADWQSALIQRSVMPPSFVYGIRMGGNSSDTVPGQDAGVSVVDPTQMLPSSPASSVALANKVANGLCQYYVPSTLPPTSTIPPKTTPGPVPPVKVRDVWPDITIMIDTSQQTEGDFEAQRSLIKKTFLDQFAIGRTTSRFSVVTYDQTYKILCTFADMSSYWDLADCLGSKLVYNASSPNYRNINSALQFVKDNIFSTSAKSDYKPLNENYLYVFATAPSNTIFPATAPLLQHIGVRTVGVALTDQMNNQLNWFGPDSFSAKNWQETKTNDALSEAIVAQATTRPRPVLSSYFADFYFVVDQSFSRMADMASVSSFVRSFTKLLTISSHRSQVSIITYADTLLQVLPLTNNPQNVSSFLNSWNTTRITSNTSDISQAIAQVRQDYYAFSQPDKQSYVIYIVGADQTIGASNASEITSLYQVVSMVLQINSKADYARYLATDASFLFKPDGSASLKNWVETQFPVNARGRNPMNQFFNRIFDNQEDFDSNHFPENQIAADIMIFLDETGMSAGDFNKTKAFLQGFTSKFSVGPTDTQFALQAYSGSIIPEAGFHFLDSRNNDYVYNKIAALRLEAEPAGSPADLSGAIVQGLTYFLDSRMGWREDATTYTLIISNSNNFINDSRQTATALLVTETSKVFAVSTTGSLPAYVNQFVNTGFFANVTSPSVLDPDSTLMANLLKAVNSEYRQQIYPAPTLLTEMNVDHIFLVDNTNINTDDTNQIHNFLLKFVASGGNFNRRANMAVINYNSQGVTDQSWNLTAYTNAADLSQAIRNMQLRSDGGPANLDAALASFMNSPSSFGITTYRPVFVTALLRSSGIAAPVPMTTTSTLNLNYFTFVIQTSGNTLPYTYLPQLLGSDYTEDFLYEEDLSTYDTVPMNSYNTYNSFIQSGYDAWMHTYGQ